MKSEAEIIDEVIAEWNSGSGIAISVRAALWMMIAIRKGYGEATTIQGVLDALRNLSREAMSIEADLKKRAKAEGHNAG